ncbi:MAG TPA: bifunctional DNA-binding transcriptional regulator/O6-methylguanine-DNA methyltransferase Ada [Candidatus Acidoferrum sp.]|jgi:AraC family transcriptional regulator of adaptative response/methylated-DNA-[protein]-cysteine methyltransferase|nr:bifunctional DNA-binding transcriptional regulator/O6-methylguanine-DNA methyltransferase Ada [Candidatus Acidoferrum sp.]
MDATQTNPMNNITPHAAARYWRATLARDSRADGTFVLAVRSTRIYCRPSCPARRPLRRNVTFFRTREEAERHGYRPCLRCRPNEIPATVALVQRAARHLSESSEESISFGALALELGATPATLRRAFLRVTGLKPRELAEALRLKRFKALIRAGKGITDALYETGYGSSSRLYERSNSQLGMTPATYRKGGKGMKLGYTVAKSPLGKVLVAATERGVSAVYLGDSEAKLLAELREEYPRAEIAPATDSFQRWVREIALRIEGRQPHLELPLDLQATAFQRRVWKELQRIPRGRTRTYSQVARSLGQPRAVRAVARACATNPVSIVVPCHRVIREDGTLAGYRWGLSRKEKLLAQERAAK